jgi:DNA-binding MarR family transcriptional regulator
VEGLLTEGERRPPVRDGGRLISQAHQLGQRVFARILKAHGIDELNPAQGRILYALWREDGLSQSELCRRTKLDKSTMALMLGRLEAGGQVERGVDPRDARLSLVRLTPRNRSMHAAYAAASEEMLSIYYRGFSTEEIEAFESALARIIANLESAEA